ncbi:MAG: Hpt domain-containing protein [Rubrivivax sp.]|nr:Hpt domain-containing protein [Rubrivivax sp.]
MHAELRKSLENAHKSLRRYLKETESPARSDLDTVDPAPLRSARTQLHQGVGALELVGLPAAARLLRGSEGAVQRLLGRVGGLDEATVHTIERASFALLDYLGRLLAGKRISPVSLFPQYAAVQALAGADRVHPADLWEADFAWHDLPAEAGVTPRAADEAARGAMEAIVLRLMRRADPAAWARLSDLCAELAAGSPGRAATLWRLASAFAQAEATGRLPQDDVHTKRVAARLLAQLRLSARQQDEPSERLAHDLLFFCAHARPGDEPAARLESVRRAWGLEATGPVDYLNERLGRFDPAWIAQARKRVAGAKDVWSAVAGGESHRLGSLQEQMQLLADSVTRLFPAGAELSKALIDTANRVVADGGTPAAPLAMEVATSVLYLDATLEDGELDQPDLEARVHRLAQRIVDVRGGAEPQALEPWMEELYRRVSDRQTMGSVVQELRASLSEVEKQIDQYFRNPVQRELLIPVPGQLSSMRGVLSVLGMDQASQAVLHMRDDVDALAQTEVDPQQAIRAGTFDRLADNLGALSFLIDMLSVQPQLAKSLFRFDPVEGSLSAVMGQSERPSAFGGLDALPTAPLADEVRTVAASVSRQPQADHGPALETLTQRALAADLPGVADAASSAQRALAQASDAHSRQAVGAELAQTVGALLPPPAPPAPAPAPVPAAASADDAEMREVFLEEAREVIDSARASLDALRDASDDLGELTTVRRAFHTLKGSSRMVGLREYGEAAWACEQLYNARLAQTPHMDADLDAFSREALDHLAGWTDAIAAGQDEGRTAAPLAAAADALRLQGQRVPIAMPAPAAAAPVAAPELPAVSELPSLDLDFGPPDEAPAPPPLPVVSLTQAVPELPLAADLDLSPPPVAQAPEAPAFELDLGGEADLQLDGLEPAPAPQDQPPLPEVVAVPEAGEVVELDFGAFEQAGAAQAPAAVPAQPLDVGEITETLEPLQFGESTEVLEPLPPVEPEPVVEAVAEPVIEPAAPAELAAVDLAEPEEPVKQVGPLSIPIPLFNIYLNEADELSRRLATELAEWAHESDRRPVSNTTVVLAHSLAGSSATVGFEDLSRLARALEHTLMRAAELPHGDAEQAALFNEASDEIRRLLHQFAAGFLPPMVEGLIERLADLEDLLAHRARVAGVATPEGHGLEDALEAAAETRPGSWAADAEDAEPLEAAAPPAEAPVLLAEPLLPEEPAGSIATLVGSTQFAALQALSTPEPARREAPVAAAADDIEAVDAIDPELFPIFEEEAEELLPQLQARLREWALQPSRLQAAEASMRTLHTLKGGARLAGAMRLGEMAHRLETAIEHLIAEGGAEAPQIESLLARADSMSQVYDGLRHPGPAAAPVAAPVEQPLPVDLPVEEPAPVEAVAEQAPAPLQPAAAIDWSRFGGRAAGALPVAERTPVAAGVVRVRAGLLDRLVSHAGEVSITRARIDSDVHQLQAAVNDLTENLDRMRSQLRDIELQAEGQIASRIEAAKAASQAFDPLEMDRFTRFQELTRMMAESVNDVATVQRSVQRTLQSTEDELASQARLTRELQDDLLRTRMVEFDSLSDRLYRVVRQAAKDSGKQVRLDVVGGSIDVDRGVLERMVGPFEHLLRNCVAHGIEAPAQRQAAGKDATGEIRLTVTQEGNEIGVDIRDDGAGLDFARIRRRGEERGLIAAGAEASEAELANLIFLPGFSTASEVTELAGRGVGLDVVRAEVNAMGGRIETGSTPGQGTSFKLVLPLTTAVTQVVLLRCGELTVAVPSTLIEVVRRVPSADVEAAYDRGTLTEAGATVPFFWLGGLLQHAPRGAVLGRSQVVVLIRSAAQRVAVHVDEVVGNQEVVVKNVGPQLSRLPGLAGVTLLPSGAVALIYNPVALAALYGDELQRKVRALAVPGTPETPAPVDEAIHAPLVLVVDDSLTVRRVTQRLLVREGYRVALAKDGMDALEKLAQERPAIMLSDIEMPRMDGFDLVRNVRADAALADLPVVMITSRIAQKHRDYAAELGVDHYLGKPYSEEELLRLVARYARREVAA